MGSRPHGIIIPTAAPAINPALIPTQNPVHIFIFSHSFIGTKLVWPESDKKTGGRFAKKSAMGYTVFKIKN